MQIFARDCLFFVSQGTVDSKEALTLPGQNAGRQMSDGGKQNDFPWPWYKPFYLNRQVKGLHGY